MKLRRRSLLVALALSVALPLAAFRGAPIVFTYVDPSANGCKTLQAVGSISSGSNQLTLTSNPGFVVNDHVIVETGAEAGAGAQGTIGVGGAWPALSYSTTSALLADTSQPNFAFAWAQDTGYVSQYNSTSMTWTLASTSLNWRYWWQAIPRALIAKITAISGNTLTLDTNASSSATNANIYFNNTYPLNALISGGSNDTAYVFPSGTFYFSGPGTKSSDPASINVTSKTGILIGGQGKGNTILRSPKGAQSFDLDYFQSPQGTVCGLTIYGNFSITTGYGWDYRFTQNASGVDVFTPNLPNGILFQLSDFSKAHDVDFQYSARCVVGLYSSYCEARHCTQSMDGPLAYIQWSFDWVNCYGCWSYDCSSTTTYLKQVFECFASNNCGHIRPTMTNGVCALNSAGNCVIDTPTVTITTNSQLNSSFAVSPGGAIFDINENIPQNIGQSQNTILNMNVNVTGYCNSSSQQLVGVDISGGAYNTIIKGGTFNGLSYAGGGDRGAQAVISDSNEFGTIVQNLTCTGTTNSSFGGNINVANGKVIGCTAPSITCNSPQCVES